MVPPHLRGNNLDTRRPSTTPRAVEQSPATSPRNRPLAPSTRRVRGKPPPLRPEKRHIAAHRRRDLGQTVARPIEPPKPVGRHQGCRCIARCTSQSRRCGYPLGNLNAQTLGRPGRVAQPLDRPKHQIAVPLGQIVPDARGSVARIRGRMLGSRGSNGRPRAGVRRTEPYSGAYRPVPPAPSASRYRESHPPAAAEPPKTGLLWRVFESRSARHGDKSACPTLVTSAPRGRSKQSKRNNDKNLQQQASTAWIIECVIPRFYKSHASGQAQSANPRTTPQKSCHFRPVRQSGRFCGHANRGLIATLRNAVSASIGECPRLAWGMVTLVAIPPAVEDGTFHRNPKRKRGNNLVPR
jgi:hypothetical protein